MEQFLQFFHNHTLLFAGFFAVLLLLAANEIHGVLRGAKRLSPVEAVRLINDANALIVDVRPHTDYKRGHILNAVSVPLAKLDERVADLGKDKARPLIVCCALGASSPAVGEKLRKHGFEAVFPLKGGLNGWQAAGLPVTTK